MGEKGAKNPPAPLKSLSAILIIYPPHLLLDIGFGLYSKSGREARITAQKAN